MPPFFNINHDDDTNHIKIRSPLWTHFFQHRSIVKLNFPCAFLEVEGEGACCTQTRENQSYTRNGCCSVGSRLAWTVRLRLEGAPDEQLTNDGLCLNCSRWLKLKDCGTQLRRPVQGLPEASLTCLQKREVLGIPLAHAIR